MTASFIYTKNYSLYDYGPAHPMKTLRLRLCYELLEAYKIFQYPGVKIIEPIPADISDVIAIHDDGYIKALKAISTNPADPSLYSYGLGFGDNPGFKGVYDWSMLYTGGSIQAAKMVSSGEANAAFNIAGGLHHAMPEKASGFCYINDAAVAINHLLKQGKRVAYIDIDAHHGDGVQHIFYSTDKVLTISFHESGEFLFPGTGYAENIGTGEGMGYSVNLPFYPGTGDSVFVWGFEQIVPPLIEAYKPDFIVTQLGVDSMATDPLAHLMLTTNGFCAMIERMRSFNIPWIALGGGGYNLSNVARAWALAFSIMCSIELPDEIPGICVDKLKRFGLEGTTLRDKETISGDEETTRRWAEEKVSYIQKRIFPLHGL
ncbi:MAG TPA: acetoin utilization protein AcuC [Nitrospiraceae bacterium]|nr:acetoin utilization protein AcuC [Nitrospiraceae bacterium]